MRPAPIQWPNDAKIAVSFFVAFEAFDKSSQYRRNEGDKPDYASLGLWRVRRQSRHLAHHGCAESQRR